MAELAFPILGLGLLVLISNKDGKDKKGKKNDEDKIEKFTNMGKNVNSLPNTHIPNKNFPIENQPIDETNKNYVREYLNQNQTTDKFFNSDIGLKNRDIATAVAANKGIASLSGKEMSYNSFQHNNMVPFFGSTVKGPTDHNHNKSILDNMGGAGSEHINKVEAAPLFKPEDNMQWSHGAPCQSDFFQTRELPSSKMANVLPWEQQKVAPGLGLGYTTEGAGGFNSGMLDRKAWEPPTVNELRAATNPKVTYGLFGHEGPAQSEVQNRPIEGKMEKNRPDTDFAIGQNRWLTTTGSSLGQTQAPKQMLGNVNKCTTEYFGGSNGGDEQGSYIAGHYETGHRQELCPTNMNPVSAAGQGASNADNYSIKGYNIPKNNRTSNCQSQNEGTVGAINSTVKAMMAPIMDALRPSRKENIICNANILGNIQSSVPNLPLTNPNNKPKTTNKEMTAGKIGLNYLNVSHISVPEGGYQNTEMQVKEQQRNLGNCSTEGYIGNTSSCNAQMDVKAWNQQHNNVNKTYENWPMVGGTQIFDGNVNVQIDKKDADRVNNRLQCEDFIRTGHQSLTASVPSAETYGKINMPQQYGHEVNSERMNPDILTAFKNNPYAQSLNSY